MSMNEMSKRINKKMKKKIEKNKNSRKILDGAIATTGNSLSGSTNPAYEKRLKEEERRRQIDEQARLDGFKRHIDYSKSVEQQKADKQAEDERELIDFRANHNRVLVADAATEMQHEYDIATDDSKGVLDDLGQGHVIDEIEAEAVNLGSTAETIKHQFKPKIEKINKTTQQEIKKHDDIMLETIKEAEEPVEEPQEEDEDDMSPLSRKRRYM